MSDVLYKYPLEVRKYVCDFSAFEELSTNGDSITSIISITATPSGLTIGTQAIDGNLVTVVISAGDAGETYTVNFLVALASGSHIEGQGILYVMPNV